MEQNHNQSEPKPDAVSGNRPEQPETVENDAQGTSRCPSPKEIELQRLSEIVNGMDLFHADGNGEQAYAKFLIRKKEGVVRIDSRKFRRSLIYLYRRQYSTYPSFSLVKTVVEGAAARAQFQGDGQKVNVRVGEAEKVIYIDLCNPEGQVVRMVPGHWEIVNESRIRFLHQPGMLPLPTPIKKGKISDLWGFLNLKDEGERCLLVSWLIQAYMPQGPFPVLWCAGPQGAGKSTGCRIVRELIDPNVAPVRSISQSERDMVIAASNSWVIGIDNLSHLKDPMSDAMCRIATGAGFSVRRLFSDADEQIMQVKRPQIVNGIDDLTLNSDLMDRGLFITLQSISETARVYESEIWPKFKKLAPSIFGALLDGLAQALNDLPNTKPKSLPRMADFARLAIAAEKHFGFKEGTFMDAYGKNREASDRTAVESTPMGLAILRLLKKPGDRFEGNVQDLLNKLREEADPEWVKSRDWPHIPRPLSVLLRRIAPNLQGMGIDVQFPPRTSKARKVVLTKS